MYSVFVRQLTQSLRNLDVVLGKAEVHAQALGFDVNNFLGMRLAPDMLPFVAQIRIACDTAKNLGARVADQAPPSHADEEQTLAELRERIIKVAAYLDSLDSATLDAADGTRTVPAGFPRDKGMALHAYLVQRQVPNFYFHLTTAYAILRHGGVPIGKMDYLGELPLVAL